MTTLISLHSLLALFVLLSLLGFNEGQWARPRPLSDVVSNFNRRAAFAAPNYEAPTPPMAAPLPNATPNPYIPPAPQPRPEFISQQTNFYPFFNNYPPPQPPPLYNFNPTTSFGGPQPQNNRYEAPAQRPENHYEAPLPPNYPSGVAYYQPNANSANKRPVLLISSYANGGGGSYDQPSGPFRNPNSPTSFNNYPPPNPPPASPYGNIEAPSTEKPHQTLVPPAEDVYEETAPPYGEAEKPEYPEAPKTTNYGPSSPAPLPPQPNYSQEGGPPEGPNPYEQSPPSPPFPEMPSKPGQPPSPSPFPPYIPSRPPPQRPPSSETPPNVPEKQPPIPGFPTSPPMIPSNIPENPPSPPTGPPTPQHPQIPGRPESVSGQPPQHPNVPGFTEQPPTSTISSIPWNPSQATTPEGPTPPGISFQPPTPGFPSQPPQPHISGFSTPPPQQPTPLPNIPGQSEVPGMPSIPGHSQQPNIPGFTPSNVPQIPVNPPASQTSPPNLPPEMMTQPPPGQPPNIPPEMTKPTERPGTPPRPPTPGFPTQPPLVPERPDTSSNSPPPSFTQIPSQPPTPEFPNQPPQVPKQHENTEQPPQSTIPGQPQRSTFPTRPPFSNMPPRFTTPPLPDFPPRFPNQQTPFHPQPFSTLPPLIPSLPPQFSPPAATRFPPLETTTRPSPFIPGSPFVPPGRPTPPRGLVTAGTVPPSGFPTQRQTPPQSTPPRPDIPPTPSPTGPMIPNRIRGKAHVICEESGIDFNIKTIFPFTGQIFAHDRKRVPNCVHTFQNEWNINISFSYAECGIKNAGDTESLQTQFHLQIIVMFEQPDGTSSIQSFMAQCFHQKINYNKQAIPKRIEEALEELKLVPAKLEQKAPVPIAEMRIVKEVEHHGEGDGEDIGKVDVGQPLRIEWSLKPETDAYGFHVRDCYVIDAVDGARHQVIDAHGCSTDINILGHPHYDTYHDIARTHWHAFKVPDNTVLSIKCNIQICTDIPDSTNGLTSCDAIPTPPFCPDLVTSPTNSILFDVQGNVVKRHAGPQKSFLTHVHADICFGNSTDGYCNSHAFEKARTQHLERVHKENDNRICTSRLWLAAVSGLSVWTMILAIGLNIVFIIRHKWGKTDH